jgi:hypothetical protein
MALPLPPARQLLLPLEAREPEEGKGERAIHHLRLSSRHRSVSLQSHLYPLGAPPAAHVKRA